MAPLLHRGKLVSMAQPRWRREYGLNLPGIMTKPSEFPLPANLPEPLDDGAAQHLIGLHMPKILLRSTSGEIVDVSNLSAPRTVIYCYPMTGVPGQPLPEGWDSIPGARGCTPQSCSFRDHHQELLALHAEVFGLSTQTTLYQREMAERLHLPFAVLSDESFELCDTLQLPTFEADGTRLLKRLTLIVKANRIEHVFYPVFPPDKSADEVLAWLKAQAA
jgi:peroxiredoxin